MRPEVPLEATSAELQIEEAQEGLPVEQSFQRLDSPVGMNCRRIQHLFLRELREQRW